MQKKLTQRRPRCSYEEEVDRIMFQSSHSMKGEKLKNVVIASPQPDAFAYSLYNS